MDELIVQAEPLLDVPDDQISTLQNELASQLKAKGLRTIVQMMAPGSLERTEFKARRIIDKRDVYDQITSQAKDLGSPLKSISDHGNLLISLKSCFLSLARYNEKNGYIIVTAKFCYRSVRNFFV